MSKILELKIGNFSGGISDGSRKTSGSEFIISQHFDIFTDPNRLIPYRSLEADTNDGSTSTGMKQYFVKDFAYASAFAYLYGLGRNGSGFTKIVYKADATTGNWTLPASSEGDSAVKNGCLVEYKDYLWGFQGTNKVFKYGTLSGAPSITNSVSTTSATITSIAQGIIAKDDNLYLPYNNIIARVTSSGTFNDQVLILPTQFKITSLANYGNYLAIACAPISTFNGVSKVFLWNLISDDVTESIDWGEGQIKIVETIEGMLVGVTDFYLNNTTGAGRGSFIIKGYSGGVPQVLKEVFTQKLTNYDMPISKAVKNNRLFFAARVYNNLTGTEVSEGIWSFGRKNASYPWAVTLDIIDSNANTNGIQSLGTAANYFFTAHSSDGSIDKTDDAANYTFTSSYETQIIDTDEASITNQIMKFSIMHAPIVAGSVTVKYKTDADTSWTTIGSSSTVNSLARDFYHQENDGNQFKSFRELKIRLESTGGVEITGLKIRINQLNGSNNG